jgi:hypothetical protein
MSEHNWKKGAAVQQRRSFLKSLAGGAAAGVVALTLPASSGSLGRTDPEETGRISRTKVSIHSLAVPRRKA